VRTDIVESVATVVAVVATTVAIMTSINVGFAVYLFTINVKAGQPYPALGVST
jgi:hypothetical protein